MKENPKSKSIGDVAIIGMAGRFPGARNIESFWHNLKNGVESIRFFTDQELAAAGVDAELLANPSYVKARGLLEDIDMFDAGFFGILPREAETMDPQQRLFLETSWEALENAGYDSEKYDGAIGLSAGVNMSTYLFANLGADREYIESLVSSTDAGAFQIYLANEKDHLTTRVAYKLNLKGPAMTVQTACSTSLVAVCQACQSLLSYQCDMVLAGGVAVTVPQMAGHLYREGAILSPDGHCRAFDAQAQGTLFGSGVGIVMLKRLEDAVDDGDSILAVIKGFALNNDGSSKVTYTAPSVDGQADVIALAQALAGVDADTISYVEAHGTGTPLGDPIEIAALTQAFRQSTDKKGFCGVGSVKSNIGHLDSAAGVTGLIKTVLALQHKLIPPSLHYTQPNPKIDFANSPFYVVARPTEWPRNDTPRRAGVSSFGIGGTNAHLVLEEAPPREPSGPSRSRQLLLVSARSDTALDQATTALATHLRTHPDLSLADTAYTLQVGRRAFPHRRMAVCGDAKDAVEVLEKRDSKRVFTQTAEQHDPPVMFMFPGQGAQYVNMGAEIYRTEPVFKEAMDRCAELLHPHLGLDLRSILYPPSDQVASMGERLLQTQITQPALFAIEYALAQLWISWGVRPVAMIGHSVGEYVAGCLAGVFPLEDALPLVADRARLVQAQPRGAMVAVRLPESEILRLLNADLSIATINSPSLCVVSGPFGAVEAFEQRLKEAGVVNTRLHTSHAFHSAMMEPVLAPFTEILNKVRLQEPKIRYVSNVTGRWVTAAETTDPHYWAGHVRQAVRFADGVALLLEDPHSVLLEVGPGHTLTALTRQHPACARKQVVLASLPTAEDPEQHSVLTALGRLWMAGVTVDWPAFYAQEQRRRVALPTYPFERQRCWIEPDRSVGHRASLSLAAAAPTESLPAAVPGEPTGIISAGPPATRKEQIVLQLKDLLRELSGIDCSDVENNTTFVEMGFESLFLTQVSAEIEKRFGLRIAFRQLLGEFSTLDKLADQLESVSKPAVAAPPALAAVSADLTGQRAPLTEAQREVWLATMMGDEASCVFNQSCTLILRGLLRREALDRALEGLISRHEALRSTFSELGDFQQIATELMVELPFYDLSTIEPSQRDEQVAAMLAGEASKPFDLVHGPVLRARVVKLEDQRHVLMFTIHHIVCDGRSLALLLHDLGELYSAECQGLPSPLPPPRSLREYAQEGARLIQSPEYAEAEAYWLKQFVDEPPALELPTDRPRPPVKTFRGALINLVVPPALCQELRRASARYGCTLFTTLLAAYFLFLNRLTDQNEIVAGVPVASPGVEGKDRLVAHTVNFLPVRSRLADSMRWTEHLEAVKQVFLEAYEHRHVTYGTLIQKLKLGRNLSRMPLVSAAFNFAHGKQTLRFFELQTQLGLNPYSFTNYDLNFDFSEDEDSLELDCIYNADLFELNTIQRWMDHLQTLLESIAAHPTDPIAALSLLSERDQHRLLVEWNSTRADYPRDVTLTQLFEAQAARTPQRVAVVAEDKTLTYSQLNTRANQLGAALRACGVRPDSIVGLYLERSSNLLVALLGVLKAGGTYLPLDPAFPRERLAFMVEDSQASVLLTDLQMQPTLPPHSARVLLLDDPALNSLGEENLPVESGPEHLAYVLYTSGSTGKPKGVQISHRAVVNFLHSMQREPGLTADDILLAVTTLSFDIAGLELYLPLMVGARVVVASRETAADGIRLADLMERSAATVMQATPATWRVLVESGWKGNPSLKLLCGGEALSHELAQQLLSRCGELWNLYGPTETTIWSTAARVTASDEKISIGRPIANTEIYILDSNLQPVPVGVAGELHIGGDGLARGYLNRDELTAERFINHPFNSAPRARLYKTGDLARYRADGNIEHLGRLDFQVKLRGFRIELGEIESLLRQQSAVREAVVVVREDTPGDQRLVAYLLAQPGQTPDFAELRQYLRTSLPDYMVPSFFVLLDTLPLTPNGKIDRRALPVPEGKRLVEISFVAPRTPLEESVASVWQELLGIDRVGIHDDFFDLGGHSLTAIQVKSRLLERMHVDLPLRSLFESPTVASLAEQIEAIRWSKQSESASGGNLEHDREEVEI
ncbi:MAG: amino acid adenylation domain-containing protein [Acidobacteriia bacterium]|nr:amino acid adenylation domain-containing protein [Terriglobia bacterium]